MTSTLPVRVACSAVLLQIAMACASSDHRSAKADGPATRYDQLLPYIPEGMESVLAFDMGDPFWPPVLRRYVKGSFSVGILAGRRFQYPSRPGLGAYEGVHAVRTTKALADLEIELGDPVRVGGRDVYEDLKSSRSGFSSFYAKVEPDVVLMTTSLELMKQALAKKGPGARQRARSMGWEGDVGWQGPFVLLRRPDPKTSDVEEGTDARPVLWLRPLRMSDDIKDALRVSHVAMKVIDPGRLDFEAQVRVRGDLRSVDLRRPLELWETWGGIRLDLPRASIRGDVLVLVGSAQSVFLQEGGQIAPLMALMWMGARIFI